MIAKTKGAVISILVGLAMLLTAGSATAQDQDKEPENAFSIGCGTHASVITSASERSLLAPTFGWEVWGRYNWRPWGVMLKLEQNLWFPADFGGELQVGVFNVAAGPTLDYANDHMRASVILGTSTLLFNTFLDEAGTTGLFFDFRPSTIVFDVGHSITITIDPLTITTVAPVFTGDHRLIQLQYRAAVGMEVQL